jgi:hypothetical protein
MTDPEANMEETATVDETTDEGAGEKPPREKGSPKTRDLKTVALQSLQRARRTLTSPEGEADPRSGLLIQASIAYALLDVADAIRSHGSDGGDEESEE